MAIVPVPIFIHVREKSAKELMEERKSQEMRDRLMEAEKRREEEKIRRKKLEKARAKEEMEKEAERRYEELRRKDQWQTQFLPEGWTIFGQKSFAVLTELNENPE